LIVRDLWFGRSRFKDSTVSLKGILAHILNECLKHLVKHGVAKKVPAADGTKRLGYQLTEKVKALGPILAAIRDWGLAWEPGTQALMTDEGYGGR